MRPFGPSSIILACVSEVVAEISSISISIRIIVITVILIFMVVIVIVVTITFLTAQSISMNLARRKRRIHSGVCEENFGEEDAWQNKLSECRIRGG